LPAFDRPGLEKLLKRRKGLDSEQVQQIIEQAETMWQQFTTASQHAAHTLSAPYNQLTHALTHYLKKVDWTALSLPDRQRELMTWLGELGIGTWALKQLSDVDWQALSEYLQQQQDLSQSQIQQLIYQLREVVHQRIKAPRRWATRSAIATWNFGDRLQDYLRYTEKADLDAPGIQASLSRLLQDAAQTGVEPAALLESPWEQALLITPLRERADMSEAEAEQVFDQIEAVRVHLLEQTQQTESQMRSHFDDLLSQIRQYLGSLQLPDLNADSLKQDLYQMLDLPQAGLELLSDSVGTMLENLPIDSIQQRLSQLNRDTLTTVLKARDDLSETVSSRVIEQVEGVRDQVMQQVEQVQQATQRRLTDLKQQAQQQARATRKAAAIAAWWLFCTALSSLTTAAIAGMLAVTGIHIGTWSF
jgi:gas vesicle protein